MKYLNVAEKNDAAKTIAGHLSRGTSKRREGLSTYNKIYEFDATVFGQKCNMIMTSVSGHLLTYEFVGAYKVWQSCNPLSLFEAPVVKSCPEDYVKIKQTLEREIRNCQGLIVWTDCDREGENIGFEIIQVCTEIKSNLKIYRAKFSEITSTSVNRALQTLGTPDKRVSDAVDVRQELDLRIGAAFTRFQTLRLQKTFPEKLATNLISYGSCQFPTLGFVVERYRAVESFISESFWKIEVSHVLNDLKVDFSWKRSRLFDEQACLVIHDICTENPRATVESIKSKPKSKWRPLPLDTIELEKLGSRKLRINAKEVMKIAEKLYTQGIISYPRTETNIYPKELNLTNLVNVQLDNPEWGSFAQRIMDNGGPNPRQGKKSDQAHPPIHPTKHVTNLSGNEKKVYELIVRSFLACCSSDAQGHETIVDIDIAGEKFTANGLMIIARNYLDVYPYDKWSGKEIHVYQEGQIFDPTSIEVTEGHTSAPSLLTEADLISLMEKHGIGTDATHADHIETIKSRSYVALADNIHFVPGLLGMGLVEGYDSMGLSFSKPNLRANLEADLKAICEGQKSPQVVLSQQIATYRDVYVTVTQNAQRIDQALSERFNQQPREEPETAPFHSTVMKCRKCNSDMTLRKKKNDDGYFISCMGYPQCKSAIWLPSVIDKVVVTNQSCEQCGPRNMKLEFTWKNRSLDHLYPSPYTTCISGCDTHLLQTLNINSQNTTDNSVRNTNSLQSQQNNANSGSHSSSHIVQNPRNRNNAQNNHNTAIVRPNVNNSIANWFGQNPNRNSNDSTNNHISSSNHNENTATTHSNTNNSAANWFSQSTNNNSNWNSTNGRTENHNSSFNNNQNQNFRARPENSEENQVVCNCGEIAILLTVRKTSPNQGRQFYKCSKPKEQGGCNFFLWAEGDSNSESHRNNSTSNNHSSTYPIANTNSSNSNFPNPSTSSWNNAEDDVPKCRCNLPSKKITVHKEGPNKGRCFYGCSNQISQKCNFFQWADENQTNSGFTAPSTSWGESSSSGRGRGNHRGSTRRTTGGERARKRCGNCREEGHTRNKCPRIE